MSYLEEELINSPNRNIRDIKLKLAKIFYRNKDRYRDRDRVKDVHRRQKLTTDFFKLFELTILVVNISISRKKMLTLVSRGSFLRGLITKS